MLIVASRFIIHDSLHMVRDTVSFGSAVAKRTFENSCCSRSKRQRFSQTLPPCFPTLPDHNQNDADVIDGLDVPSLNLSMKQQRCPDIFRSTTRCVSVSPDSSVDAQMLGALTLEASPAWSMDAEEHPRHHVEPSRFRSSGAVLSTLKTFQIFPKPQRGIRDAYPLIPPPPHRRSEGLPSTIFLPQLPSP
jgi:hypothetical protein